MLVLTRNDEREIGQVFAVHDRMGGVHRLGVMILTVASAGSPLVDSFSPAELEPA